MASFFAAIVLILHLVWWLVVIALGAAIIFVVGYALVMLVVAWVNGP